MLVEPGRFSWFGHLNHVVRLRIVFLRLGCWFSSLFWLPFGCWWSGLVVSLYGFGLLWLCLACLAVLGSNSGLVGAPLSCLRRCLFSFYSLCCKMIF